MVPARVGDTRQTNRSVRTDNSAPDPTRGAEHSASTYGIVYVNDLARASMSGKGGGVLAAGSIIVREKLSSPSATKPDLLAVMIKRQTGFNPAANDWEFLVVTGDGKKIERREKTGACQECHASQSTNDFVFRDYSP